MLQLVWLIALLAMLIVARVGLPNYCTGLHKHTRVVNLHSREQNFHFISVVGFLLFIIHGLSVSSRTFLT